MMRRKTRNRTFVFFGITVAVIVAGISFLLLDEGQHAGALKFSVPVPLDTLSLFDDRNPDITCEIYMRIHIVDADGNLIKTKNTMPLSGNPTFALVDSLSGKPLAGYNIQPMMGCNSKNLDVTIDPSDLFLIVTATDSDSSEKNITNKQIRTKSISLPAGSDTEKAMGYFGVYGSEIENGLTGEEFQTKIRFEIVGTIKLHYTDYAGSVFYFPISKPSTGESSPLAWNTFSKIQSKVDTTDNNDFDGDGILNVNDACPDNPETYNGYQDTDGCPDTAPTNDSTLKTECIDQGGDWIVDNNGDGFCNIDDDNADDNPPPETPEECNDTTCEDPNSDNPIDTTEECVAEYGTGYTWNGSLCVPPETTEDCNTSDPNVECVTTDAQSLDANVIINTVLTYSDGSTQAFVVPLEGQSPFNIELNPATLVDTRSGASGKEITDVAVETFLLPSGLSKWTVTESNLNYVVTATSNEGEIRVGEFPQQTFTVNSGSGANPDFGISLGKSIIKNSDINSVISENISVPVGTSKTFNLKIVPTGNIFAKKVDTEFSGVISNANVNWSVIFTNPKVAGTGGTSGGNTDVNLNCTSDERIHIFPDGKADCVPKGIIPKDSDGDGELTSNDEQNACTIGEEGCDICISDENPNGFPCDVDYRNQYCGADTQCEIDPDVSSNDFGSEGCTDSFGQPTVCTSDPKPNSNDGKGGSGGTFCPEINGESVCPEGFDDTTMFIIIAGVIFFLLIAVTLARRR